MRNRKAIFHQFLLAVALGYHPISAAPTHKPETNLHFDALTLYGLVAVSLMLLFYWLEDRSNWYVLAFAVSCLMASVYGFLQGAWPFGFVESVWSVVALRRWWLRRGQSK